MNAQNIEPALQARRVSRRFRRRDGSTIDALLEVDMSIHEGEFVCIVGPSGCGKSTLLQLCAGLDMPSDGVFEAHGKLITGPGPDRGVVFQKDSVFPWLTVIDNVEYGLRCRGVPASERRQIALRYLDHVGLSDVAHAWPRELSGGMLKRVAIACVFANGSDILLLDEPFGAVDYVTRHKLHDVLLQLWDEADRKKRTVLFVTHDVDEALMLADRILVIRGGRVVDDLSINGPRPRGDEYLASGPVLLMKRKLLEHLGISHMQASVLRKETA